MRVGEIRKTQADGPLLELEHRPAVAIARWVLAAFYVLAGVMHLTVPRPFVSIVPPWVPDPAVVVTWTGVVELLGSVGLVQSRLPVLRRAAGAGLALYALCVWPANVQHMLIDLERPDGGLGLVYHLPRLAAQPLLIWLALWTGKVVPWSFNRR